MSVSKLNCNRHQTLSPLHKGLKYKEVISGVVPQKKPINPKDIVNGTKKEVLKYQPTFVFGDAMLKAFYYFGATYNECVYRNTNGLAPKRYSIPAPTGSSKSTSAKVYLSKIGKMSISGLLVVGKVSDAIKAVEDINILAGKNIAACIYTVDKKHPDNNARVEIKELPDYPIAVITHSMFLSRSASHRDIKLIKNYDNKQRKAVIIDEHIDFKRTISFSSEELLDASRLVKDKRWEPVKEMLESIGNFEMEQQVMTTKSLEVSKIIVDGLILLKDEKVFVGLKKDVKREDREKVDRVWLIDLLERVHYVYSHQNMVVNQGKYNIFSVNEDLTNQFGSAVILDATSDATPLYLSHALNRNDIELFTLPKGIRSYANATLHICYDKNRKQSKTQLVDVAYAKGNTNLIVDSYLDELYPLVFDGSKLLIVTFMGIEEIFRTRCKDDNITFIHWGEHEGRNDFSQYSKAAAIGWFRKSKSKYYQDLDAILPDTSKYSPFGSSMAEDVLNMIMGGLASDFIQFFNRTRSRVAVDKYGNCKNVDLYIFDDGSADNPISIIRREMPGIKLKEWKPIKSYPIVKLTLSEQRAERIVKWLSKQQDSTIISKSIESHFDFSKQQVRDIINKSKLFKILLHDLGINMRKVKGRYGGTHFDIP